MPKRQKRFKAKKQKVKLPEKPQPAWKKMAGIASNVADKIAVLPGTIGLVGKAIAGIKNLINVEDKYNDVSISGFVPATGVVTPLTLTAQGNTDQTRNGNSILSKRIDAQLSYTTGVTASSGTICRTMLILDKDNAEGTAPTISQILSPSSVFGFANLDNSDRFVKLTDDIHLVEPLDVGPSQKYFEIHKDLSDLHIKYDGANATQANATQNHLYLVQLSSTNTTPPLLSGQVRYKFYDN